MFSIHIITIPIWSYSIGPDFFVLPWNIINMEATLREVAGIKGVTGCWLLHHKLHCKGLLGNNMLSKQLRENKDHNHPNSTNICFLACSNVTLNQSKLEDIFRITGLTYSRKAFYSNFYCFSCKWKTIFSWYQSQKNYGLHIFRTWEYSQSSAGNVQRITQALMEPTMGPLTQLQVWVLVARLPCILSPTTSPSASIYLFSNSVFRYSKTSQQSIIVSPYDVSWN